MSSYRVLHVHPADQQPGGYRRPASGRHLGQHRVRRAAGRNSPASWSGLTTTITPTTTNDFRFSYLRNFWQWGTAPAPPQLPGLGGAVEIGGESLPDALIRTT